LYICNINIQKATIYSGLEGSRTPVQKPIPDSSTSVVCYLDFPQQPENKHSDYLSSFMIRTYTQSLVYAVSYIV